MTRFDSYVSRDGFDLVVAYHKDEPAGQAWGWPLGPDTGWWDGLLTQTEPGFTDEDGTRTFALSETLALVRLRRDRNRRLAGDRAWLPTTRSQT